MRWEWPDWRFLSSQRHQLSPEGVATRATACFDPYTDIAVPVLQSAEFDLEDLQNDASLCATHSERANMARATTNAMSKLDSFFSAPAFVHSTAPPPWDEWPQLPNQHEETHSTYPVATFPSVSELPTKHRIEVR